MDRHSGDHEGDPHEIAPGGEDCFLVKVHAATIEDLESTLDRFLLFGQTITSIVVSNPVPLRPLPVEP